MLCRDQNHYSHFFHVTGGNVVRVNRTVMQMVRSSGHELREQETMESAI